jgi:hypothetical protein
MFKDKGHPWIIRPWWWGLSVQQHELSPYYKRHMNSSEGIERDMKQQE